MHLIDKLAKKYEAQTIIHGRNESGFLLTAQQQIELQLQLDEATSRNMKGEYGPAIGALINLLRLYVVMDGPATKPLEWYSETHGVLGENQQEILLRTALAIMDYFKSMPPHTEPSLSVEKINSTTLQLTLQSRLSSMTNKAGGLGDADRTNTVYNLKNFNCANGLQHVPHRYTLHGEQCFCSGVSFSA